jgi:hypothetical protein
MHKPGEILFFLALTLSSFAFFYFDLLFFLQMLKKNQSGYPPLFPTGKKENQSRFGRESSGS